MSVVRETGAKENEILRNLVFSNSLNSILNYNVNSRAEYAEF